MDLESVFDKHGENDENSDDSVISYTNPNVLEYDDNVSECYSERSYHSMANDPQVFPMNIPGNIPQHKFPLGFSSTHRVNILSRNNSSNEMINENENKNEVKNETKNEMKNESRNCSNNSSMKNIFDEIESIENFVDENENENMNFENKFYKNKNVSETEENLMKKSFRIERNILGEKSNKFSGNDSESKKKKKTQKNENTATFFSNFVNEKFSI